MRLHPAGREVYAAEVTTDPPATGVWNASFDGGVTWIVGTDLNDGSFGWLVRGPENSDPDNLAVFAVPADTLTLRPLLRLQAGDEDIVIDGPSIDIQA